MYNLKHLVFIDKLTKISNIKDTKARDREFKKLTPQENFTIKKYLELRNKYRNSENEEEVRTIEKSRS